MGCVESTGVQLPRVEQVGPAAAASTSSDASESQFQTHYSLSEKLIEGTFAEVWSANSRLFKSAVTVKILDMKRITGAAPPGSPKAGGSAAAAAKRSSKGGGSGSASVGSYQTEASSTASLPRSPRHSGSLASGARSPRSTGSRWEEEPKDPMRKFDEAVRNELAILGQVGQHRNCVRFYESFREQGTCYIITEHWKETLLSYAESMPQLPVQELQRVLTEMAAGVAHIHQVGVMHRNIKPENFVLTGESGKTIKLTDFGMATQIPTEGSLLHKARGSLPYMSPEMLEDEGYDQSTDVWSLGATYYMVIYGNFPYCPGSMSSSKMKATIIAGAPAPTFKKADSKRSLVQEVPEGAEDLVRCCLERHVCLRTTAAQLVRHEFLQDMKAHGSVSHSKVWAGRSLSGAMSTKESNASTDLPSSHLGGNCSEASYGARFDSKQSRA